MAIMIHDGWGVAHHHIHEALSHLGQACEFNKIATQKYCDYERHYNWQEYLSASAKVALTFNEENKQCIKATILFQAGMEDWISWAYTESKLLSIKPPKTFSEKWEKAFNCFGSNFDFEPYKKFYEDYRNPIVHPSSKVDVEVVASIWCKPVHLGLKAGWDSMSSLSTELGL